MHTNRSQNQDRIQASQKMLINDLSEYKDSTAELAQSDNWYNSMLQHQQLPTMISGFTKPYIGVAPIAELLLKSLY